MTLIRRCLTPPAPASRARGSAATLALSLGVGVAACCWTAAAWAQTAGALDPVLIAGTGTWSETQAKQVTDHLRANVGPMLTGDEPTIERSRDAILAPFRTAGVSEPFIRQYARAVAREIAPATQAEAVQVRINAMILTRELPDPSALAPVAAGLQDQDSGVRYLAAVALNGMIVRELVPDDQRGRVMELVEQQLAQENSSFVAAPMFKSMLDAGAFDPLLKTLNDRVGWHVGRANVGFAPEAEALRGLYSRLFVGDGSPDQVRQLGRASVRYLRLAAQQLEAGNVANPESHVAIIRVAHTALTSVRDGLNSSEPAPPDVVAPITQQRWADIVTIASRWADLLQAAPVSLPAADLETLRSDAPPAAEPAAATTG